MEIKNTQSIGRGIFTKSKLEKGTLLIVEQALARGLYNKKEKKLFQSFDLANNYIHAGDY